MAHHLAKHRRDRRAVGRRSAVVLSLLLATAGAACGPSPSEELGKAQYDEYCASCHPIAEGDRRAVAEGVAAPDLRELRAKYGSPLDRDRLARFIDGREDVKAHGPRGMPVWGKRLYEDFPPIPGTEEVRRGTIALILDYLESVQTQ